ncbi:MAG: hypothetical protein AB7F31_02025 [Parachlamydiales bacterium]
MSPCELGERSLAWHRSARGFGYLSAGATLALLICMGKGFQHRFEHPWGKRAITALLAGVSLGAASALAQWRAREDWDAFNQRRGEVAPAPPPNEVPKEPPTFPYIRESGLVGGRGSLKKLCAKAIFLKGWPESEVPLNKELPEDLIEYLFPLADLLKSKQTAYLVTKLSQRAQFSLHCSDSSVLEAIATYHPHVTCLELLSSLSTDGVAAIGKMKELKLLKISEGGDFASLTIGPSLRYLALGSIVSPLTLALNGERECPLIDAHPHLQVFILRGSTITLGKGFLPYLLSHTPALLTLSIHPWNRGKLETSDTEFGDLLYSHPSLQKCDVPPLLLENMTRAGREDLIAQAKSPNRSYSKLRSLCISKFNRRYPSFGTTLNWERLPYLETLDLGGLQEMSAQALPIALRHCPSLATLITAELPTEEGLGAIPPRSLPLKSLSLSGKPLHSLAPLLKRVAALETLYAESDLRGDDPGLDELLNQSTLKKVDLSRSSKWNRESWVGALFQKNGQLEKFAFLGGLGDTALSQIILHGQKLEELKVYANPSSPNWAPANKTLPVRELTLLYPSGDLSQLFAACPNVENLTLGWPKGLDLATLHVPAAKNLYLTVEDAQFDNALNFVKQVVPHDQLHQISVSRQQQSQLDKSTWEKERKALAHIEHVYIDPGW